MIRYLLEKEFKQIFRNAFISESNTGFARYIYADFPWVVNQEIKNLKLSVVDNDRSTFSERLIHKITASGYFHLFEYTASSDDAIESVDAGKADIILEIPRILKRFVPLGADERNDIGQRREWYERRFRQCLSVGHSQ